MGEAAKKKKARKQEFEAVDRLLRDAGVDTSRIEFYNQSAFLEQEHSDPEYARHLTRWLSRRPMSDSYRSRAGRVVPAVAERVARCGSRRLMLAAIADGPTITRLLAHLGLPTEPLPVTPAREPPQLDFAW